GLARAHVWRCHTTRVARAWLPVILRARVPRKKSGGCGVYVVTRAASASLPVFVAKASSPGHSIIRFQASRYWSTNDLLEPGVKQSDFLFSTMWAGMTYQMSSAKMYATRKSKRGF